MHSWFRRSFDPRVLRTFWAVDAGFIILYLALGVLVAIDVLPAIPDVLSIGRDWSAPETFNYIKWSGVIILLVMTALRDHSIWPVALGIAFVIILADDALMMHEALGPMVGYLIPAPMRNMATSEGLAFAMIGVFVLLAISVAFALASRTDKRKIVTILCLIGLIAFFAIVVDMGHESVTLGLIGYSLWVVVEDGGELLVTSAILAYVYRSIWKDGVAAVRVV